MDMPQQYTEDPVEIQLSGKKLDKETTDLETINKIGRSLLDGNKDFIRQKVKDNWYGVIEPISGVFIASENTNNLYNYTTKKYPNRLLYVIGLLRGFI